MTALSFPESPSNGDISNKFKYNGTRGVWEKSTYAVISGGTEVDYTDSDGQDWHAHVFETSGTLTVYIPGQLDTLCLGAVEVQALGMDINHRVGLEQPAGDGLTMKQ